MNFLFMVGALLSPLLGAYWEMPTQSMGHVLSQDVDVSLARHYAVWAEQEEGKSVIMASEYDEEAQMWREATPLTSEKIYAEKPIVVSAKSGAALIIWEAGATGKKVIQAMVKPLAHDPWLGPFTLSGMKAAYPQVAMDVKGNALIAWCEGEKIKSVQFKRGAWQRAVRISNEGGSELALTMNHKGKAALIWQKEGIDGNIIEAAFFDPLYDMWSSPEVLADVPAAHPCIALNNQGEALALWEGNDQQIHASLYSPQEERWSTPTPIAQDNHTSLFRAILPDTGKAAVWWVKQEGPAQELVCSRYEAGQKRWMTPEKVSEPDIACNDLQLKADPAGNCVALWTNSQNRLFATVYEAATKSWLPTQLTTSPVFKPKLVLNDLNHFTGTYLSDHSILFLNSIHSFTPLKPQKLTCERHLSLFLKVTHTLNWEAPQDPAIVAYRVRYKGEVVKEVLAAPHVELTLTDRDRLHDYVYEVTSLNAHGKESLPAAVRIRGYY